MLRSHPIFATLLIAALAGVYTFGQDSPMPWVFLVLVVVYGITKGPLPAITPELLLANFNWMRNLIPKPVRAGIKIVIVVEAVAAAVMLIVCHSHAHSAVELVTQGNVAWVAFSVLFGLLWPRLPQIVVRKYAELLDAFYPRQPVGETCLISAACSQAYVPAVSSDSPYRPPRFYSRSPNNGARVESNLIT